MNANLLQAMLGGAGAPPASSRRESEGKNILSFKAGKMSQTLQPNGKYLVTPDARRGTIDLTWHSTSSSGGSSSSDGNSNGMLKFEWTDRRTRTKVDTHTIFPEDNVTYTKIDTGRPKDRVYLLQYGTDTSRLFFYWMQDKEEGNEDEDNCVKINMYCADANEARIAANGGGGDGAEGGESTSSANGGGESSAGSTGGADGSSAVGGDSPSSSGARGGGALDISGLGRGGLENAALMQIMQGLENNDASSTGNNAGTATGAAAGSNPSGGAGATQQGQVDALSNILENLGRPPQTTAGNDVAATPAPASGSASTDPTTTPTAPTRSNNDNNTGTTGGGLTLSDLQGAMATLATTSPPAVASSTPGPPLSQIATPEAVMNSGILDDPEAKSRLIALLPDDQRSEEHLMENLRSPQVVQCLKSLTEALCDDSVNSILANFQLRPEDGAMAMASGNPIQAFLDCVLKSVEREEKEKENSGDNDEQMSG